MPKAKKSHFVLRDERREKNKFSSFRSSAQPGKDMLRGRRTDIEKLSLEPEEIYPDFNSRHRRFEERRGREGKKKK